MGAMPVSVTRSELDMSRTSPSGAFGIHPPPAPVPDPPDEDDKVKVDTTETGRSQAVLGYGGYDVSTTAGFTTQITTRSSSGKDNDSGPKSSPWGLDAHLKR
ncbi:hypothetical protein Bbelb_103400 [Branchiostoma belcheri]|nr:hypothetical protein Bbelb_103400 [Branchiostoma belcheri]